jgi:N-methylhydantoinase B
VHGDTSDVPVEMQEAFNPYRFESYAIRADSGGVGRFRGGVGVVKTYQVTAPCRLNLKIDRTKCLPWGLEGGGDGMPANVEIRRTNGDVVQALKGDHELRPGDVVVVSSGGGGGFGDAWDRDLELVARDVQQGYVSPGSAERDFGVVFAADMSIDVPVTKIRRNLSSKVRHAQ